METEKKNIVDSEVNNFDYTPSPLNTSCSGGTITDISFSAAEENELTTTYVLTINELRSCSGFEDITMEHAEVIIQKLSQLSDICYHILL
jgi:hypothetical protein